MEDEMVVVVKSRATVRPAQDTPKHTLWVSSLDLLVPRIHIRTVYLYNNKDGDDGFFNEGHLKRSLANALVPFYPVAGRLGRDGGGRIEIDCNGQGVTFITAEASFDMKRFGDFTPGPQFQNLVPTVDYSADIASYPLLLLQVTSFKCGGVCLGVALHHTLADGTSASHFIKSWSNLARGLPVTPPPFLDRTLLRARNPPTPKFHHSEYDVPPRLNNAEILKEASVDDESTSSTATLKITLDQLDTLRRSNNTNANTKYSTYELLAAHIWRAVCRARGLSPEQATKLYVATDGRNRLSPQLPPGFFANVLFTSALVQRVDEVVSGPLGNTMMRMRKALMRMDDEYLRSALDYLEEKEDLTPLIRGAGTFSCPNINIVSWIRMTIHDADLGWGKPVFMGPASVIFEGMAYIIRSPAEDGSLDVFICLQRHHMELFRKFLYDF